MKAVKCAIASFVLLFLFSCNTEYEFSNIPCFLVIDNATHNDPTLAGSLNPMSSGIFCYISIISKSGVQYFAFTDNNGNNSTSIFNAIDSKRSLLPGINNGIFVGYSIFDPHVLYAYDRQCPNCTDPNSPIKQKNPLTMSTNGIATCAKCGRQYDMNNGGIISKGAAGEKMIRYRVASTSPFGVLNVNN